MRATLATAALLTALVHSVAAASPLEDSTLGGAVFTGPIHGHPSAMYLNPAGLGLTGRGWHLYLGGSLRLSSLWIDRNLLDVDSGQLSSGPSVTTHTPTPGGQAAWYASFRDGDGHFGVSVYVPNYERFPSGEEALRYHSLGGHFLQGMMTLAGSYRFGGRFIFGLGFSLGYSSLGIDFARDTALEGGSDAEDGIASDCGGSPCGVENELAAERYNVDVSTARDFGEVLSLKNVALAIGFVIRIRRDMYVSLSYAGLPGAFTPLDLGGDVDVTTAPRSGGNTLSGIAEITVRTPHTVLAGYRANLLGDADLVADVRWQDLSRHDQLDLRMFGGNLSTADIPEWYPRYRGFSDVWRLSAGLEQREGGDPLRLGGRIRLETGAVDAARATPVQVAGASVAIAGGAELRIAQHVVLGLGYDLTWFPTLDSGAGDFDPRDRLDCVDSQYDYDRCAGARQGRALPTASGTYRRLQQAAILSIRYDSL